jgi:hypothetical protein
MGYNTHMYIPISTLKIVYKVLMAVAIIIAFFIESSDNQRTKSLLTGIALTLFVAAFILGAAAQS